MDSILIIALLIGLIIFLLMAVKPGSVVKVIGQSFIKLMIGALFLFFLNAVGNQFGLYIPINFVTAAISGLLGLPGVAALSVIQLWIIA
ncbi:sigma-K factor-processing regulatory protein BofA [Siminovitchia terrae]|uniref:Pro-sigmaK processing inhibitor BofA n=1 Tax=Siminovitchia terrae TaxID=1914933 RepID=A0A429X2V3_SIMTE|nr:pro-sigmaK processing inhibitor BofA family protein [Siminovitchia terrae]RST57705.1 pro-sigmaK processing inhibitor BofA [Siminovitchia terrae]GIN93482.1 sigma-K factor-processing regulatory protein BofA [Siminovitchia terrae]GIN99208.1 sigma-K factor-processing regulatory protein BofA [Siminovitchia terrae]